MGDKNLRKVIAKSLSYVGLIVCRMWVLPQVPVSKLAGKTLGLYFSIHWSRGYREFTPKLDESYNELLMKGYPFKIVFVDTNTDEGTSFNFH